jgi:hypothetical protein
MKTKVTKTNLFLIIAILTLIGYIIFASSSHATVDVKAIKYKNDIDSLSRVIDGLEREQGKLDSLVVGYKSEINKLDCVLDSTQRKLKETRNKYGDKIKDINNYTHAELSNFFTERYK